MIDWGCKQIKLDDLVADIMPHIYDRGNPDTQEDVENLVAHELNRAVTELAEDSKTLTCTIVDDLQCGVCDYPIEVPEDYRLIRVDEVSVCGQCWNPSPDACSRCAGHVFWLEADTLILGKPPFSDGEGDLEYKIVVAPDYEACEIPETFYRQYRTALRHKVLSELYSMKAMDWFDPNMSTRHNIDYRHAKNRSNTEARSGRLKGPKKLKPSSWV